ncbi:MAG: dihydroneopterin aldolase [Bacteroidales bacterium]|nr:dihydroneopterin aldolase [Bacteroidales bacterium]
MSFIDIENMEFYSFHGCFSEEASIGTHFSVDLRVSLDTSLAQLSDNISDTVSYLDIYQTVKREMQHPSHLLENVAERIASSVLREYEALDTVRVKITKLNPPLGGKIGGVSLTIEKSRS